MSKYVAKNSYSFQYPADTVDQTQGGFDKDDNVIGRAVRKGDGNSVVLVKAGDKPWGVIVTQDQNGVGVDTGPVLDFLRGGNTALTINGRVTGATRVITSGGTAQLGYVANGATDLAGLSNSTGTIWDGGGTSTANTEGVKVRVLMTT